MVNLLQEKWEKRATVRSRPRLIYDKTASGYYYPISRAPLARDLTLSVLISCVSLF